MKQLPNILTISRILLTIVFIWLITQQGFIPIMLASIVFLFASLTDYYDGYLAKKRNTISNFGAIMDPIADKFLILVAFFIFVQMKIIPGWMFVLIFLREMIVTASRLKVLLKGKVLSAEKGGKFKTVAQIIAIWIILIYLVLKESKFSINWTGTVFYAWNITIMIFMLLAVGLTVISGVFYLRNYRKFLYAP